jgi:hypothetical protein
MKKVQILHSILIGALLAMVAFLSVLAYRQARLNKALSGAVMTLQRIEYDRLKTEQTKDREAYRMNWQDRSTSKARRCKFSPISWVSIQSVVRVVPAE